MLKKVAILTSGGDAPGMNNAIWALVKQAERLGIEPFLVFGGYKGLHAGDIKPAADYHVEKYIAKGGTFIFSSRFPEFKKVEVRKEAKAQLDKMDIDALVVIGGDGSYHGAQLLHELGVKTIGLPGTIDNDISSSDVTIGYDTALNTIVSSVDRVRDTMTSHNRAAIIEVMGHGAGDLALYSGLASAAEVIITNENLMTPDQIADVFKKEFAAGKHSAIAIVSEFIFKDLKALAAEVEKKSGVVTRAMSLEHTQRGGVPSAMERINSSLMGIKAMDLLSEGKSGLAIGILSGVVTSTPIMEALGMETVNKRKLAKEINQLTRMHTK